LLTDLYQLTMLQGYFEQQMNETAVFEFFVRKLPRQRNFLVAAGLQETLEYLQTLRFADEEIAWLASTGRFTPQFVESLRQLRFTGDVHAMPEGTLFFPDEPILRITAPLPQAQLVESRLINILHFQTLIASKAARCVLAAPGKLLVDFGLRRAHGGEAGLWAARASYLAGFGGTATVAAGPCYGIPLFGTMAHSFVQTHDEEVAAFEHFALAQPDNVVLLIDTYDTEAAARKVVALAPRLHDRGIRIKGVRIDSGDLADHAHRVRAILDDGGLHETTIFCSGNIDEYSLSTLVHAAAPIDGFGIGTHLDTSNDAPYLDCAYKLQEYAGKARRKRSEGKATWPGRKQVFRRYDARGQLQEDCLTLESDAQEGEPLLTLVMRGGQCLAGAQESLSTIRDRVSRGLRSLPPLMRGNDTAPRYRARIGTALQELTVATDLRHEKHSCC
jgi:nicotinate phosphoribosyltransferase